MKIRTGVKFAIQVVGGIGLGYVVASVADAVLTGNPSKVIKVAVNVGTLVCGMYVAHEVLDHWACDQIDEFADALVSIKDGLKAHEETEKEEA